jgi:uncharacterized protein DUF5710
MNTLTPPFDPPYISTRYTENGEEYIETLADGTTRPSSADKMARVPSSLDADAKASSSAQPAMPKAASKTQSPGRVLLKVPFAEKDDAKGLGAKWDAAQKKWYVPHGVDVNLFTRWWPDALRDS